MILVLVMALVVQFPRWMISPGELTLAHANLNGECLACHQPFAGVTNEKCIACHRQDGIGSSLNVYRDRSRNFVAADRIFIL